MLIEAVTSFVVIVEVDAVDSVVPVGGGVVTDVDCSSVGEYSIVDDSWIVCVSRVVFV